MGVVHQGEIEGCGTGVYENNIIYIISTNKENILPAKIVDTVLHMYMFVVSDFFVCVNRYVLQVGINIFVVSRWRDEIDVMSFS